MAGITQREVQNIKRLIQLDEIAYQKLNTYSNQAADPQIKQLFTKEAQETLNAKQKLISFLNN